MKTFTYRTVFSKVAKPWTVSPRWLAFFARELNGFLPMPFATHEELELSNCLFTEKEIRGVAEKIDLRYGENYSGVLIGSLV